MFKRTRVSSAILAGSLGGLFMAGTAIAQERVEITGSRIKTTQTETASPVIQLGAEAIKIEAVRDVESLLNNLPQVFADQGAQVSNGATGTATVNLRNLGAARTLVLVNGRRLPAGSPRSLPSDLNQIPISLIKRVEVLTGGASAVYGSDAVAGVVNFVMNDRFEGIQAEVNHQFYNHQQQNPRNINAALNARGFPIPGDKSADGKTNDFSLTMGANFGNGKGNATLFVSRKQTQPLLQSERDFTACALNAGATAFTCGGSGTSFPGQFTDFATFALTVADAQGGVRNYVGAQDAYNFGPLNYFQRPSDRYTAAAYGRYDISPMARVYTELNFHDDHTVAQIAPSGAFFFAATGANAVRFENPLLSAAWRTALGLNAPGDTVDMYIARRNVEGGGRQDDIRHTSYRGVLGVKGDLNKDWSYDLSTQVGRVVYQETYKNDFSNARLARALDVVDDGNGNAVCRTFLNGTDTACVPWNIWRLGGVTPASLAYVSTPGFQKGFTSQSVTTLSLFGDLGAYGIKSPAATTPVNIVVGAERRTEQMDLSTDTAFTTGDLAGQGGPTIGVAGKYSVTDIFGEIRIPLVEGKPMAELLNLTGTYRRSDYSTKKKTDAFGLGLEWAPVRAVKLRASYQEAVRAPNIIELFAAQGLGLYDNNGGDPCSGAVVGGRAQGGTGATLAECQRTGVTPQQFGTIPDSPAGQFNQITGGNPNLNPEKAKTTTFGIVLSPIRDLNVTIDYFDIKVNDIITNPPAVEVLNGCLATGALCNLIQRDGIGSLWATNNAFITVLNNNLASRATQGIDFAADYRLGLGAMGRVDLSYIGTYLKKFYQVNRPGTAGFECAGYYGGVCGTPLPEIRHKIRATWTTPWNLQVSATVRHIDGVSQDSTNPQIGGAINGAMRTLGARQYLDLAASYQLTKNLLVRGAVNNVLDKDPPLRSNGAGFANGNTYPVVYDAAGRRVSLNVTATF
ncbi:MAG: TonB-dependent receptor domain-containing protein [Aquabacterium sp.]